MLGAYKSGQTASDTHRKEARHTAGGSGVRKRPETTAWPELVYRLQPGAGRQYTRQTVTKKKKEKSYLTKDDHRSEIDIFPCGAVMSEGT